MRKIALLLLILAGCGSKPGSEAADPAAPGGNDLLANLAVAAPDDAARLQALIERAMPAALARPKDAQYRNVRAGTGGSACGEVAPKAGAPFVPFVVTPDALAVIGTKPAIAWEDPDDFLADAWIRWCASPEELARLGPTLANAARSAVPLGNSVTAATPPPIDPSIIAVDPVPPPPSDSPMPAPAPAPRPKAPPPPPQIDSFFNSVQHKEK